MPAKHVYSGFKDVSETVLTRRPGALTHSYTVLRRSTDGQSRLWDGSWRLSRGQGTLANGCRTPIETLPSEYSGNIPGCPIEK